MKNYTDAVFKGYMALKLPFLERQKTFRKLIKNIQVNWKPKNKLFEITISYKLPIEDELYLMDSLTLHVIDAKKRQTQWVNTTKLKKHRKVTIDEVISRLQNYLL